MVVLYRIGIFSSIYCYFVCCLFVDDVVSLYLLLCCVCIVTKLLLTKTCLTRTSENAAVLHQRSYYTGQPPEYGRSCDSSEQATITAYYSL